MSQPKEGEAPDVLRDGGLALTVPVESVILFMTLVWWPPLEGARRLIGQKVTGFDDAKI